MATIFISYRRADSADISGRIYDRLTERFGREHVFKDVDSIPPGVNFPDYIAESIAASDVALIIIGPRWLDASAGFAQRRLDDTADFVRVEIETALRLGVAVIPVLVGGARMPAERRLPESLRPLLQQNGVDVRRDPDFSHDMDRVFAAIDYWQGRPRRAPEPIPVPSPAPVKIADIVAAPLTAAEPRASRSNEKIARQPKNATAIADDISAAPARAHNPIRPLAPILAAVAALLIIAVGVSLLFSGNWERIVDPSGYRATQTASAQATLGHKLDATWTAQAQAVAEGYTPLQGIGPCAAPSETYTITYRYYWETLNSTNATCSADKAVVTFNTNGKRTSGATYHGRMGNVGFPATFTASFTIGFVNGASPVCAYLVAMFRGELNAVPPIAGRYMQICGDGTWKDIYYPNSNGRIALKDGIADVSIHVSAQNVEFIVNGKTLTNQSGNTLPFDQLTIESGWESYGYDTSGSSINVSRFIITPS